MSDSRSAQHRVRSLDGDRVARLVEAQRPPRLPTEQTAGLRTPDPFTTCSVKRGSRRAGRRRGWKPTANVRRLLNVGVAAEMSRPPRASAHSVVRAPTRATLVIGCLTAVAAVLRFAGIGHQGFWYDEEFTVALMHHSLGGMLGMMRVTESNPPLYYCVAWVWARIFGYGEAGLRSLSALAGVATIPAMYAAGAKLISRRAGLVAAAIACFSPLLIWYSQEARSYELVVLFATLSLFTFAHARSPRPMLRWLLAWALAASLTFGTHYFGALIVVPEALWLLWVNRRDRRVLVAVGAVAAIGLALMPLALAQRTHNANWIGRWPLYPRLSQIAPLYVLGTGAPARTWLKLAGAATLILAVILLVRRADAAERRGALLAGALAVSGFLLCLMLLAVGNDELIARNVIVILVPLIVFVAGGLGARHAGVLGALGVALLCAIGLIATIGIAVDRDLQRPDWRPVARTLQTTRSNRAGRAILIQDYRFLPPLSLYMPRLGFFPSGGALVNELDLIAIEDPPNAGYCWWGSACNLPASTLYTAIHIRGFRPEHPVLRVNQFSILRLRSAHRVRVTPREIFRALRGARLGSSVLLVQPPA